MGDTARYYEPWLDDANTWPSSSRNESVPIEQMAAAHAINAYRRLEEAFGDDWQRVRNRPLPMALLRQAVGDEVVYDYVPDLSEPIGTLDEEKMLEACYNALMILASLELTSQVHIIRKARVLATTVAHELNITLTKED